MRAEILGERYKAIERYFAVMWESGMNRGVWNGA